MPTLFHYIVVARIAFEPVGGYKRRLRRSLREIPWRAVIDDDEHYVYAIAL